MSYTGSVADDQLLDFYDFSKAARGFERSLAITTHFVIHNEIITQVTSLRGAQILCSPPSEGSFKLPAWIFAASVATYSIGSLENNNPLGHIIFSIYELAIYEATGQKVDYEKSLREIYNESLQENSDGLILPKKYQIEALVEKIETSISDMHRPIIGSETADSLDISDSVTRRSGNPLMLNKETYERLKYRKRSDDVERLSGKVSMFNMNTFNGRLVTFEDQRPIPFYVTHAARSSEGIQLIGQNFSRNISNPNATDGNITFEVIKDTTRTGRTAKLLVVRVVFENDFEDEVIDPED
jgi:hypothetical protein